MARLYSRKRGQSRSKKPHRDKLPEWVSEKPEEIEKIVVSLAEGHTTSARIGLKMRDQYGIPDVRLATKKTINQILSENNVKLSDLPEDLNNLMLRAARIQKHLVSFKQDMDAKRGLQLTQSKIRRLAKYYKRTNVLPADWKYESKKEKVRA